MSLDGRGKICSSWQPNAAANGAAPKSHLSATNLQPIRVLDSSEASQMKMVPIAFGSIPLPDILPVPNLVLTALPGDKEFTVMPVPSSALTQAMVVVSSAVLVGPYGLQASRYIESVFFEILIISF